MNHDSRLPRSLKPLPGESLAGYLLNLSHRLRLAPGEVATRVGLCNVRLYTTLNLQHAIALPVDRARAFSAATGLSLGEVRDLTWENYEGCWFEPIAPNRTTKAYYGALWAMPSWMHFCPRCLAEPQEGDPDRRLWRLDWTTPWSLACAEHRVLLSDSCPAQSDHLTLARDPQALSLVRAPRHPVGHPAACRHPVSHGPDATQGNVPLCGRSLANAEANAAPGEVLALQGRLDSILRCGTDPTLTALGLPVSPDQYLRDLRLLAILLQVANDPSTFTDLPQGFIQATIRHLDDRQEFRGGTPTHHRTWAQAPSDPRALATLLTTAATLLDGEGSTDTINHLVGRALNKERARWTKLRWYGRPSDRLAPLLTPERTGIISTPNLRRASGGRQYALTADSIPAYLPLDECERFFADFELKDRRGLRRTISLGLVRLVEKCTATEAAVALGYTPQLARGTTSKVAVDLGRAESRRLQDQIVAYAEHLEQRPPLNWGHRRRYFTADWLIPDGEWTDLKRLVSQHRITNKKAVLDERRRAYSVWVWSIVTSGDPVLAPMVEPAAERPTAPGRGAIQTLRKLALPRHRSTPLHVEIVQEVSRVIAAKIDATVPPEFQRLAGPNPSD